MDLEEVLVGGFHSEEVRQGEESQTPANPPPPPGRSLPETLGDPQSLI